MKIAIAIALVLAISTVSAIENKNIHAVLIAGSNGWYNYRHQADVCHGYQSLLDKGVPADNIIVFSYNDVAPASENPFPNQLFNQPSKGKGWDVNKGCKIDYEADTITPTNYLNVLKGDASAMKGVGTGRVLKSTSEDYVFLAFYDHGGSGILGFPNGDLLYADDFQGALKYMHSNKMYKQAVYYMEACESGSMWTGFPDNINFYALSAANATQSSWGTYCPSQQGGTGDDSVDGKAIGTCLGDLFSINWMENLDQANTVTETLEKQWDVVKVETNLSHVLQWGSLDFTSEPIGDFMGGTNSKFRQPALTHEEKERKYRNVENSRDIKLNYYKRQWLNDKTNIAKKEAYEQVYQDQQYFVNTFAALHTEGQFTPYEGPVVVTDFACLKELTKTFQDKCKKFDDFGLQYVKELVKFCQHSAVEGTTSKKEILLKVCTSTSETMLW